MLLTVKLPFFLLVLIFLELQFLSMLLQVRKCRVEVNSVQFYLNVIKNFGSCYLNQESQMRSILGDSIKPLYHTILISTKLLDFQLHVTCNCLSQFELFPIPEVKNILINFSYFRVFVLYYFMSHILYKLIYSSERPFPPIHNSIPILVYLCLLST